MPRLALCSFFLLVLQPVAAPAQPQHASSDRKTIEISATEKVQVRVQDHRESFAVIMPACFCLH